MSKVNVKLNGKIVVIDTARPKVANALAALIEACAERQFPIGMVLEHENGGDYLLTQVKTAGGRIRAYLHNTDTGRARNSRKVVIVQEPGVGTGYVTDLPAENDRFYDPENPGQFIDC